MQISAIAQNYNCPVNGNIKRNNVSQPAFQAGLNNIETDILLSRLAKVNDEVFESFNMKKLKETMDYLINRYKSLGVKSPGVMIVSNDDLPKLLGKDVNKYNIKGKTGLCVAVGDKNGPLETMTNIYHAKTFLIEPNDLKM